MFLIRTEDIITEWWPVLHGPRTGQGPADAITIVKVHDRVRIDRC